MCLKNGKSGSIVCASHSCRISQGKRSVEPSTSSAREQSGSTPQEQSGSTPQEQSGSTPQEQSGSTPQEQSGSTPQDGQLPSRTVGSSSNELGLIVRALKVLFSVAVGGA